MRSCALDLLSLGGLGFRDNSSAELRHSQAQLQSPIVARPRRPIKYTCPESLCTVIVFHFIQLQQFMFHVCRASWLGLNDE